MVCSGCALTHLNLHLRTQDKLQSMAMGKWFPLLNAKLRGASIAWCVCLLGRGAALILTPLLP